MIATLTALGIAVVVLTTGYTLGYCVGAMQLLRALGVLVTGLALVAVLSAHYLDVLDGVDTAGITMTMVAALACPIVTWFGFDVGREHRAERRRRNHLKAVALTLVLACGATSAIAVQPKPAEAVTAHAAVTALPALATQTTSGALRTWVWRGPYCGLIPFQSMEYFLFNMTFGCTIAFTNAGTTLLASPWWSYFQQLLIGNSLMILLLTVNITVLQAGAQWCRAQGLTLWARWRPDAPWITSLWGIIPEMSCWFSTA